MTHNQELLIDEIRLLREVGEALMERVEDVAASIRYLTNNLLDAEYSPEMGDSLAQLARAASNLVSLAPAASAERSVPPFVRRTGELLTRCADYAEAGSAEPSADTTSPSEKLWLSPAQADHLRELMSTLQTQAQQLTVCQESGEEAAWDWWAENYEPVFAVFSEFDALVAQSPGIDWDHVIKGQGGIPTVLEPENWPAEIRESYWEYAAEAEAANDEHPNASGRGEAGTGERQGELCFEGAAEETSEREAESPLVEPAGAASREARGQAGLDSLNPPPAQPNERPYTLADFRAFCQRRAAEPLTAAEWQAAYARLRQSEKGFIEMLLLEHDAAALKSLALQYGMMNARRQTKRENAQAVYRACLQGFVLEGAVTYNPLSETIEQTIDRRVAQLTDEDLARQRDKQERRQAEHQKALDHPETLLEFHTFVEAFGAEKLTDEQHLRRDRLYADQSRETRRQRQTHKVEQFQAVDLADLTFTLKEGYHEKRGCPVWIVQLSTRVERAAYEELKRKAAQLGGWYSSFKKDETGFHFLSREPAEKFTGLRQGDADRSEELEDRRIRKLENVAERFTAMADRLEEQANSTIAADEDKLKNTVRRAEQAASVRARAREELATAQTLRSLAAQFQEGQATYLDGIRHAVQIDTLRAILRRAKWRHIKHLLETEHAELSSYQRNVKQDELEHRLPDASDIRFAEYPKPYLYRGHLERAVAQLASTNGLKQTSEKIRKLLARTSQDQDYVEFYREPDIKLLEEFLRRAKGAGYQCYWFEHCLDDYHRLQAADIHDAHELRAALAELLPHFNPAGQDDPVTLAVDALRGQELPGFFPTPRPIILQMVDLADIHGDDRVLEPSCGMGDILDCVRERHPEVDLKAVECNRTLADVLAAKGYDEIVTFGDFLEHRGFYDNILMNPPFENGAEIEHVRHAFDLLSVGGRLVSVMSNGPFFRSDAKSREFREWLDGLEHNIEELPEDAFRGIEAFRQTDVQTKLVVIDKAS